MSEGLVACHNHDNNNCCNYLCVLPSIQQTKYTTPIVRFTHSGKCLFHAQHNFNNKALPIGDCLHYYHYQPPSHSNRHITVSRFSSCLAIITLKKQPEKYISSHFSTASKTTTQQLITKRLHVHKQACMPNRESGRHQIGLMMGKEYKKRCTCW